MFSVPSKSPIQKQSRSLARPRRFHKCDANNDVIIPPRFLSSRSSSSSSFYLSTARPRIPFMSLSCTLRLVSPSSRRRHYASRISTVHDDRFTISIESNFFHGQQQREPGPARARTFTTRTCSSMRRTMRFLLPRYPGRMVCIPRRLPIAVVSIIVPVPCPLEMTAFRFDPCARMEILLRATYRAC